MRDRRDICAVVPIKGFANAKLRLAATFPTGILRGLARAMAVDVLDCLSRVPQLAGLYVVTADRAVADLASNFGANIISDGANEGHTHAVMSAARSLRRQGRGGVLTVPGDIPNITVREVVQLIGVHPKGRAFSIVPAHDRRGSNAILMTPPDHIQLAFGDDSFEPHVRSVLASGLDPTIVPLPGIGLDIDHPDDVKLLVQARQMQTKTWSFLCEHGLAEPATVRQAQ